MANETICSNQGTFTGNQNIGSYTIRIGQSCESDDSENNKNVNLTEISGFNSGRLDDYLYYLYE